MTTDTLDQELSPSPATPKKARRPRRQPKADAAPRAPRVQRTHAEKRAAALRALERVDEAARTRVAKQANRATSAVNELRILADELGRDEHSARIVALADAFMVNLATALLGVGEPTPAASANGTPAP